MSRAQLTSTVEQNTGGAVSPFVAGKNKIINGDFGIWARGTSFSNPPSSANYYTSDRWCLDYANANPTTALITQVAFDYSASPAADKLPISGYPSNYFARSTITTVGSTTVYRPFSQRIEDVRTLAGQTATISFWAKADSSRTLSFYWAQTFGTGGSSTNSSGSYTFNLTSSWQRYTASLSFTSVLGQTIGAGSSLIILFQQAAASGSVLDMWGVQLEAGPVATPFTTATGTLSGELEACRRYYVRFGASDGLTTSAYNEYAYGNTTTTTNLRIGINLQQRMRVAPTSVEYANLTTFELNNTERAVSAVTLQSVTNNNTVGSVDITIAASTNSAMHRLTNSNNTGGYLAFSAEL